MADLQKIMDDIRELAGRPRNVALAEIERIVMQLQALGYDAGFRDTRHGRLYWVNARKFSICTHHPGAKQVKSCYVREFLAAMIELELYEN